MTNLALLLSFSLISFSNGLNEIENYSTQELDSTGTLRNFGNCSVQLSVQQKANTSMTERYGVRAGILGSTIVGVNSNKINSIEANNPACFDADTHLELKVAGRWGRAGDDPEESDDEDSSSDDESSDDD